MIRIAVLLALAVAAGLVTNYLLSSPTYALYQIGRAIHTRDPHLFLHHVDLEGIYTNQKDELVDMFMGKDQKQAATTIKGLLAAMASQVTDQIRQQVVAYIQDPERENLPSAWALVAASDVTRNGDYALVVTQDPRGKQRLRYAMRRHGEGPWRVVEVDPRDLKRILKQRLGRKRPRRVKTPPPAGQAAD